MPNNESSTEKVADSAGKKNTVGKTFKFLLKIIIVIAIVLILLVAFLKEIFKIDTSDKSSKIECTRIEQKEVKYKIS